MDNRSIQALEYEKIKDKLTGFCVNDEAKETAKALYPMTDLSNIERSLSYTEEALLMSLRSGRLPMAKNEDITGMIQRAKIGAFLQIFELRRIAAVLRTIRDILSYREEDQGEALPLLDDAFDILDACEDLEQEISKKLLSDTEVADTASAELTRIRREMINVGKRITEKLQAITASPVNDRYLQEKLVTIRGGRYVVPVKAEYRAKIPGIVLDRSSSGQTLYVEPAAVVELNNDLRLLEAEEKDEIERILKDMSDKVGLYHAVLEEDYRTMIELDYVFAKAAYALSIGGNRARLTEEGPVELLMARHPLIPKERVVASDIVLPEEIQTMVITGPNTGGKTVTLKTLGLLTLMLQSGLFIPVQEGSRTRLFQDVYADIGDEQSIEQSLSTFSSHMHNIVQILRDADRDSLVLFDELGAGTDPEEGAALAVAILDELRKRGSLTGATTHYGELKEYGLNTEGVINASVEFDVESLSPTYRLLIGVPGKSNAFEIASRIGLPQAIIDESKSLISENTREFEKTIAAAEKSAFEARKALERAREREEEALVKLREAETEKDKNKEKAERALIKANEKAAQMIRETKLETDKIYREVQSIQREAEASVDNKKLEKLRRKLSDADKAAQKAEEQREKRAQRFDKNKKRYRLEDFRKGDRVYVKQLDREADVIDIQTKQKKVMIQSGTMKIAMKPQDLVKIQKEKPKREKTIVKGTTANVKTELDLRGRTVDESIFALEQFISDAIMAGKKEVRIIHGMGTGRVRAAVQDYLKKSNLVSSYRYGKPDEGGTGATIVKL